MSDVESSGVGIVILVLMLTFVAIWIWAWLPYHKRNFDLLARLPMLDTTPRENARENVRETSPAPASDGSMAPDEDNR